jgi:hypothetical protein
VKTPAIIGVHHDEKICKELDISNVDIVELGDCHGKHDVLVWYFVPFFA